MDREYVLLIGPRVVIDDEGVAVVEPFTPDSTTRVVCESPTDLGFRQAQAFVERPGHQLYAAVMVDGEEVPMTDEEAHAAGEAERLGRDALGEPMVFADG